MTVKAPEVKNQTNRNELIKIIKILKFVNENYAN